MIADGMMPDMGGGHLFGIRICDGGMSMAGIAMKMPGMDMPAHGHGKQHHGAPQVTCPFALILMPAQALDMLLAALILVFAAFVYRDRLYRIARNEHAAPYHSRGPPAFSV